MNRHNQKDVAQSLEHRLAQSIDRVRENITKQSELRKQIVKLRRERRSMQTVPDEVREWFQEMEGIEEEEE